MKNRNGPARCCCGCTTTIAVRQGCSPFGPVAATAVAVHAAGGGGPPLASGTTDAAGAFETGLPAGSYELRIRPGHAAEARRPIVLACGGTTEVAYFSRRLRFQVSGCSGGNANGSVVTITGAEDRELVVVAGFADWYPQAAGAYSYTIAAADDRYAPASGTGHITNLCAIAINPTHYVSLAPAEGFTCCDATLFYPTPGGGTTRFGKPRGPIKVTTSAGDEWYLDGCGSVRCVATDDGVTGPLIPVGDPRPTLGWGPAVVRVEIATGPGVAPDYVPWKARLLWAITSDCGARWMTPWNCAGSSGSGASNPTSIVLNSLDPLSITFNYDQAGAAWTWTCGQPSPRPFYPLTWITLTEILP